MPATRRGFLGVLGGAIAAAAVPFSFKDANGTKHEVPTEEVKKKKASTAGGATGHPSIRADRSLYHIDICNFCDKIASRGSVVELVEDDQNYDGVPIVRPGQHGGLPYGVLLNDVVEIDFSRQHIFQFGKDSVAVGSKVEVCTQGWIITGPFDKPVKLGSEMYYDKTGRLTTRKQKGQSPIGVAMSSNDEDGFVKVAIRGC